MRAMKIESNKFSKITEDIHKSFIKIIIDFKIIHK